MKYEIGKEYKFVDNMGETYKFLGYLFETTKPEFMTDVIVDENGFADTFCKITNKNSSFMYRGSAFKIDVKKYHVAYKDDSGKWRISKLQYESIDEFVEDFKGFTFTSHTLLVD